MYFFNELDVSYEYDFMLFGASTPVKDYKLAWLMNRCLQIQLVKEKDILLEQEKDQGIVISNFIFNTTHCTFRLLKNKAYDNTGFILPDQQQFDYLFMIKDDTETVSSADISKKVNSIAEVKAWHLLDIDTLLFKENLIF